MRPQLSRGPDQPDWRAYPVPAPGYVFPFTFIFDFKKIRNKRFSLYQFNLKIERYWFCEVKPIPECAQSEIRSSFGKNIERLPLSEIFKRITANGNLCFSFRQTACSQQHQSQKQCQKNVFSHKSSCQTNCFPLSCSRQTRSSSPLHQPNPRELFILFVSGRIPCRKTASFPSSSPLILEGQPGCPDQTLSDSLRMWARQDFPKDPLCKLIIFYS